MSISLYTFFVFHLTFSFYNRQVNSASDSFVYGGCSQLKFSPGTVYESNVNSLLASLVNSASQSNFNKFKISVPGSTQSDIVYGIFQCRGDLINSDCRECVAHAVSRLGLVCPYSSGAALQLDGCLIKYDSTSFLGVQDKTVVAKKCGQPIGYDSGAMSSRDSLLAYLTAGGQYYRVGGSGKVQGVAQCVEDLSVSECQDCLTEATAQLRSVCGVAAWGDMYLGKCYARFTERGDYSRSAAGSSKNGDDDAERTLAIVIGLVAVVAVLIIFLSFLSKLCDKGGK